MYCHLILWQDDHMTVWPCGDDVPIRPYNMTCHNHVTCQGWNFWQLGSPAQKTLADHDRSRYRRLHLLPSHTELVLEVNWLWWLWWLWSFWWLRWLWGRTHGDDQPCRPSSVPSSYWDQRQRNDLRVGFGSGPCFQLLCVLTEVVVDHCNWWPLLVNNHFKSYLSPHPVVLPAVLISVRIDTAKKIYRVTLFNWPTPVQ